VSDVRLTAWVQGRVQGVGFRWWVRAQALELGIRGSAANLDDGRVKVEAEGPEDAVRSLLRRLKEQPTTARRPGWVSEVTERWSDPSGRYLGFREL
jgi:acylphosphatase